MLCLEVRLSSVLSLTLLTSLPPKLCGAVLDRLARLSPPPPPRCLLCMYTPSECLLVKRETESLKQRNSMSAGREREREREIDCAERGRVQGES